MAATGAVGAPTGTTGDLTTGTTTAATTGTAPSAGAGTTATTGTGPSTTTGGTTVTGSAGAAVVASAGTSGMQTGAGGSTAMPGGGETSLGATAGATQQGEGGTMNGGGETSTGGTEPLVFPGPEGVIPNSPQPGSTVGVPLSAWQDGIISPTMNAGSQINQPVVFNGYLLVTGNEEFWFYDVSDPTSPQELSYFKSPNATGGEAESHTLSFARYGDTFYLVTIGGRGIDTWDVTDVSSPQHVGYVAVPGTNYGDYTEAIWGVTWQGQYIYVGATNNGVKVVDAEDPTSLQIVGEIGTSQYGGVSAGAVDVIGNTLVLTTPKESGGVATLDVTNPTSPARLASLSADISYIGAFYRHWVFLINPLRVWDVLSDPRNIGIGSSPIGTMNHGGAEYLAFSDDYLFLGHVRTEIGGTPGASKIDVTDPTSMRLESTIYGRQDQGGLNDDQFVIPFGNLIAIGDDQAPYHGWFIAVHDTEPDTTPPAVDTIIPGDQETGVSTQARVGISFTDNIELATVNGATFVVRPVGGEPLPGKYGLRMTVLNFDPDEDLEPGTTYEVVLPEGGVADLVGNGLATEWVSTFTTE